MSTETIAPPKTGLTFRTKRFALAALLDKAAHVVPSKELLPVLKNFLIEATADSLRVAATDLELSVIATSSLVTVDTPGVAVLPARRLFEIVKEAEDGELTIAVKDGEASITVGRAEWTLKLADANDYPELPDTEVEYHEVDKAKLQGAIKAVRHAAATETVRPSLMMLDVSGGRMRAADGVRFQQVSLDFPIDIQIPISAVDDLMKILALSEVKTLHIGQDDNALVFKVAGDVFIVQKLTATFPDVDKVLLKPALTNDQKFLVDRADFISAIKRVRITADPTTSAVIFRLRDNVVEVTSKDKSGSTCRESLDCDWTAGDGKPGPDRRVAFNHQHLLDMLAMTDASTCHFYLGPDTKTRPSSLLLKDHDAKMVGVLSQLRVDFLE